jgi:hypothetical protein
MIPVVKNFQGGFPHVKFQGGRLLLAGVGQSYSTGDFHCPDGYLAESVDVGG